MMNYEMDGKLIKPLPAGGVANDDIYETWEIKICPQCGRKIKETYKCETLE